MKKIFITFGLLLSIIISTNAFAQLDYNWGYIFSGTLNADDRPAKMTYANHCMYAVGTVKNGGDPFAGEDILIKKYDEFGNSSSIIFHYTDSQFDEGRDIKVDADGYIYVLGISQTIDFATGFNMIVLKYTPSGALMWQNTTPLIGMEATSLVLDDAGNCYALGRYFDDVANTTKGCIKKINSAGADVWFKTLHTEGSTPNSMATRNIVIKNNFVYTAYTYLQGSAYNTKLEKFSLAGSNLWNINLDSNFVGVKIAADASADVYLAGYKYGFNLRLKHIKIDHNGTIEYTNELLTNGQYSDIEIDASDNVYMCGVSDDSFYSAKYSGSIIPDWTNTYSRPAEYANQFIQMALTPNSVILSGVMFNTEPSTSLYTVMINNSLGTLNYVNKSNTAPFTTASIVDAAADDYGNFYSLTWTNTSSSQDWLVSGFHYPLYIIARPIPGTGLYDFTPPGPRPAIDAAGTIASINVTSITGAGNINVNFNSVEPLNTTFSGTAPADISSYSWFISKDDAITSINAEVRFDYTQIENAGITNPADVKIYQRAGSGTGDFTELATTISGTELRATVTSFGEFILGSATQPLPVELSLFTSIVNNNSVELKWNTSGEINNKGFAIERRSKEGQYSEIGFVKGSGTSNSANSYSYSDNNLPAGKYTYRLKQTDYNGNYKYYELSNEVNIGTPAKFSLSQNYPNPFNPSTKISFEIPKDGFVTLKIYDISGKQVHTLINGVKTAGYYNVNFNASRLSSGIYFYSISSGEFSSVKKMSLIK